MAETLLAIDSGYSTTVPRSPFSSVLNFRDIGETINCLSSASVLRPGLVFRSARPDEATPEDLSVMKSRYKIKTVIDLRSGTEKSEQIKKLGGPSGLDRAGWNRVEIDLNGGPFARALMRRLSWPSLCKLLCLYTAGWRLEAIRILGTEVMEPRGLTGLAYDSLDFSKSNVATIFQVLGDQSKYPILLHCTQGKDRTGLTMILLLSLLDVPEHLINQDYRASPAELVKEEQARLKEIHSMGLGSSFAGCPEGFVREVQRHLDDKYGGIEQYLEVCGVSQQMIANIRSMFKT